MIHRPGVAALGCALVIALVAPSGAGAQSVNLSLGDVFGGRTSQGFPVVFEVRSPRVDRVRRASAAISLPCAGGGSYTLPDSYVNMPVTRRRTFKASFGPETIRNDDGTTGTFEGRLEGRFNRARTAASGSWQLKLTERDAAGTVTDTCDSRRITWSARQ